MNIAILGTGNMGKGLARALSKSNLAVTLGGRNAAKARDIASALGANVKSASDHDAAAAADVVILAVPYGEAANAIRAAGNLDGKIVVDITNPLTSDYMDLTVGHTTSAGEEIQKLAPRAKVVKAFNAVFSQVLEQGPRLGGKAVPVYIASDDDAAAKTVADIAQRAGFEPVHVGALKFARYLEPLAGLTILLGYGRGFGTSITPAWIRG